MLSACAVPVHEESSEGEPSSFSVGKSADPDDSDQVDNAEGPDEVEDLERIDDAEQGEEIGAEPNEIGDGEGEVEAFANQAEWIDTLQWVIPCAEAGCGVAHTGDPHNLYFYLSELSNGLDTGVAYHVKGRDQRCWERMIWDLDYVTIDFDNCWTYQPPYQYSRYADGRWLRRWWAPGEFFDTNDNIYAGTWDECNDDQIGEDRVRRMTFLWRDRNHNWGGAAGVRDSIALQQSYPDLPGIREIYYYARGWGLIHWEYWIDENTIEHSSSFNEHSVEAPVPCMSPCTFATPGVVECPCTPSCNDNQVCGVSDDGCGGICQAGSGCRDEVAAEQCIPSCNENQVCGAADDGCGGICQAGSGCRDEVAAEQCIPSCNYNQVCGVSDDGCGGICQVGSGCQNGLAAGQSLRRGAGCISSVGGIARLCHQSDGNLVVYTGAAHPVWNSETGGRATTELVMQSDGNLVLYNGRSSAWDSFTGGQPHGDFVAVIQDDCNFVVYHSNGLRVWDSGRLCP